MNPAYVAAGLILLAVAALIPPPGISPIISPDEVVQVIAVRSPPRAIEQGYPETVKFYEPYVKRNWGYAYEQMINDSFRQDGLFDYARGRVLSPEEVKAGMIVGYTGLSAGSSIYSRISWVKLLMMGFGLGMLFGSFLETRGGRTVLRKEAEMRA